MPTNITFSKFEPVDNGTYRIKVTGFNERVAAKGPSRDPFLAWDLEVLNSAKYPGKKISFAMGYSIGPNAMGTKFLKALGWTPPTAPGDLQLDPNSFIGKECFAEFSREKSANGTEVNKMKAAWSLTEMQGITASVTGVVTSSNAGNVQAPTPRFDPNTGQAIVPPPITPLPKFDPNTGLPINAAPQPRFDPNTGQPLSAPTGGERTYEPVAPITRPPTGVPPTITSPAQATAATPGAAVINDADDMNFPK